MSNSVTSRSDELLDVVDEFGRPTGQVLDKAAIHKQRDPVNSANVVDGVPLGLRHLDTHVWITNGHDLLQQQRHPDKPIMPDEWDVSVGGHVGAGESTLDAAVRETAEELGLILPRKRFVYIGRVASQLHFAGWTHAHNIVGDNFAVVEPDLQVTDLKLQPEEVAGARWYPLDQLEDDLVRPATSSLHAPQPKILYAMGIAGMRGVSASLR